jgi:hypothetical protein
MHGMRIKQFLTKAPDAKRQGNPSSGSRASEQKLTRALRDYAKASKTKK